MPTCVYLELLIFLFESRHNAQSPLGDTASAATDACPHSALGLVKLKSNQNENSSSNVI